jgi:hypothetical protein
MVTVLTLIESLLRFLALHAGQHVGRIETTAENSARHHAPAATIAA